MAQYKVPQDVEADDKLLGPFNFRQFVYLLISGGLIALAVGLFQLFPLLAIIPVPFTIFFLALALPLRKDQPMETYLAALLSYYTKPRTKKWMSGQRDTTILITAPKVVEETRTRDISGEEATHRLSFLADIVDSQGFAIKGVGSSPMREDLVAEANATPDMFEAYQSQVINRVIDQDKMSRHNDAVAEMRNAIERNTDPSMMHSEEPAKIVKREDKVVMEEPTQAENVLANPAPIAPPIAPQPEIPVFKQEEPRFSSFGEEAVLKPDMEIENSDVVVRPEIEIFSERAEKVRIPGAERPGEDIEEAPVETPAPQPQAQNNPTNPVNDSIMELAHNEDFSVATIAKEANRINRKEKGEIFVSLH
jgi:hypothetical protein